MTETYDNGGQRQVRLAGLLRQLSKNLEGMRETHEQVSQAIEEGEEYVERRRVVIGEPVVEVRKELGDMLGDSIRMREEIAHIQEAHRASLAQQHPNLSEDDLNARSDLGCATLLKMVEQLEAQYSQKAIYREPETKDVRGVSVKHAAPDMGRKWEIN